MVTNGTPQVRTTMNLQLDAVWKQYGHFAPRSTGTLTGRGHWPEFQDRQCRYSSAIAPVFDVRDPGR
jgi:hypothetical protein